MPDDLGFIRERYSANAQFFDRATAVFEWLAFRRLRRAVVPRAKGTVLEVAVGTGQNLPLYREGVRLTAVDLSSEMLEIARALAARMDLSAQFSIADAGKLPFEDQSFDSVVSTFAGCTFPDPVQAYREMWRVLREGGELLLVEHGRGRSPVLGRLLDRIAPWHFRQTACHLERDPLGLLRAAGIPAHLVVSRLREVLVAVVAQKPPSQRVG